MKKRVFLAVCVLLAALGLCACGRVAFAQRTVGASEHFSPAEIEAAMDVAQRHFLLHFEGCTLRELTYDEAFSDRYAAANAAQYGAQEAIILLSAFDVDASGGDGGFTPNSTYTRWQWILTRNGHGPWTLRTWGYG